MNSFFFAINNQYLLCAVPAQGAVFSYISFVGSRTHGRGTFCSRKKYPKTRRGVPPVPQFYGGVQSASIKFGTFLPLNYVFTSDLWRVYRRCFGCRPRRHKLRIPHPAASGRLRSLRCASFFLGKRSAGLPRSGPSGAVFASHRTFGNIGGIPKGALPPLCRRGGGVHRGGTPSKALWGMPLRGRVHEHAFDYREITAILKAAGKITEMLKTARCATVHPEGERG